MMHCTTNIPQRQTQNSFHTSPPPYIPYPPTSISQNVLSTVSYSSATSSLSTGSPNIFSWAHTVPTYMPWATNYEQNNGGGLPSIVRFMAPATTVPSDPCTSQTATTWELIHNLGNTCTGIHTMNQHLKRRSDVDSDDELTVPRPVKQYISEEKMAAKLSEMHISNDFQPSLAKKCNSEFYKNRTKKSVYPTWTAMSEDCSEDSEAEDSKTPKGSVVLSPELKELMQPNPDLVKALLQNESVKTSMALVVWEPPGGSIRDKIHAQLVERNSACNSPITKRRSDSTNNNNSLGSDLNLNGGAIFKHFEFEPGLSCHNILPSLDDSDDMEL